MTANDVTHRFEYLRPDGTPAFDKTREPDGAGGKRCLFAAPGEYGTKMPKGEPMWFWNMPLLRSAIDEGRDVLITEGEPDANRLRDHGLCGITNADGGNGWRDEYAEWLTGAHVVLFEDNDETGRTRMETWGRNLIDSAASVRIVTFRDLPQGADVSTFLDAYSISDLQALIDATPEWEPDDGEWEPVDLASVDTSDPVLPSLLVRQDGVCGFYPGRWNVVHGQPESAKTWIVLKSVVEAALRGWDVVWIDYEDDELTFVERLEALGLTRAQIGEHVAYFGATSQLPRDELPRKLRRSLAQAGLVAIDAAISSAAVEGPWNLIDNADAAEWRVLFLDRIGRACAPGAVRVVIDHDPHNVAKGRKSSIGATAKFAGVTGAQLRATVKKMPRPGHDGLIWLAVTKDRKGQVRRHAKDGEFFGSFVMEAGLTGNVEATLIQPDMHDAASIHGHDPDLIDGIVRVIDAEPGQSKSRIYDRLRQLGLKFQDSVAKEAVDWCVADGLISVDTSGRHDVFVPSPEVTE